MRPLEKVRDTTITYYGGSQSWCEKKTMRASGCGVIACAQLIFHERGKSNYRAVISKAEFMDIVEHLRRHYLIVLPYFGLNGLVMSWGINRYFRRNSIKLKAHWGVWPWKLWEYVAEMLNHDILAIISIGPNFPAIWGKHKLNLCQKTADGYITVTQTVGHYVSITAMDDEWLTVSSWGRLYYINKQEYMTYVKRHSNWLFSNILYVKS